MGDLIPSYSLEKRVKCRHGYYLKVTENGVEGSRDENDLYTYLVMDSIETAEVMIKGKVTGKYIAMNAKGELYTTTRPSRPECVFKEIFETKYNSYRSMLNPDWYLALTKEGEAKSGPKTKRGQRAASFLTQP
ncbi:hypothetical protein ACROYT_G030430 [Oculina patagonica]